MSEILRHIKNGCGILPDYGEHPGTVWLVLFGVLFPLAGIDGGLRGLLVGLVAWLIFIVPIYLYGAYQRSKAQERFAK